MTRQHSPVGSNGMSVHNLCRIKKPTRPSRRMVWGRGAPCKIAFDHLEKFGCSVIPYGCMFRSQKSGIAGARPSWHGAWL